MKIVRKSSTPATNSNSLDDGHGPPLRAPRRAPKRRYTYTEEPEPFGYKSADFSHMTRHELHDLINCEILSGQLSLEDCATLSWLDANLQNDADSLDGEFDSHEKMDFLEIMRLGIKASISSGDSALTRQFEKAMGIIEQIQGQTIGVDTLV